MVLEDREFLEHFGGKLALGKDWKVFHRHGRALLLIRANRSSVKSARKLYSPQRFLAQLASRLVFNFPLFWRLLPSFGWNLEPSSVLGTLIHRCGKEIDAILLGNPTQEARRLIVLTKGSAPMVLKIGMGEPATSLVRQEANFISNEGEKAAEIPPLKFRSHGENWECFGIPYFEPGDATLKQICKILDRWWSGEIVSMKDLSSWSLLEESTNPYAPMLRESCAELKLKPARLHGDLAPWNIRFSEENHLMMIDWEAGQNCDVPCWDLVHFLYQQYMLVERLEPEEVCAKVLKLLAQQPASSLLLKAGWAGQERLLFASYLIAMATEDIDNNQIQALLRVKKRE